MCVLKLWPKVRNQLNRTLKSPVGRAEKKENEKKEKSWKTKFGTAAAAIGGLVFSSVACVELDDSCAASFLFCLRLGGDGR